MQCLQLDVGGIIQIAGVRPIGSFRISDTGILGMNVSSRVGGRVIIGVGGRSYRVAIIIDIPGVAGYDGSLLSASVAHVVESAFENVIVHSGIACPGHVKVYSFPGGRDIDTVCVFRSSVHSRRNLLEIMPN